jgi:FAD/FMN-containing dehydrogenase
MAIRRRKHWGWGSEDQQPSHGGAVDPAGIMNPGMLIDPQP